MTMKFLFIFGTIFVCQYYATTIDDIWNKKDWKFKFIEYKIENKYPKYLEIYMYLERVSRGVYGTSGNLTIKTDLIDEQTTIGVNFLKSGLLDNTFRPLPLKIPTQKIATFMNFSYKLYMHSFQNCSNLPLFEREVTKKDLKYVQQGSFYYIEKCVVGNDVKYPNHLDPGLYKIIITVLREPVLNVKLYLVAEVTPKLPWA